MSSKRQRGVGTAAKVLILIVATTALLGTAYAVIHYVGAYVERVRAEARADGRAAALKEVAERDNAELRASRAEVAALRAKVQTLETDAEDEIAAAAAAYEKEKQDDEAKIADLTRRVRAGEFRLRDPGGRVAQDGGSLGDGSRGAASPAATAGAGSREAGAQDISPEFAGFLVAEATRADEVVGRLNLCKATIQTYLKTCNAPVTIPAR